MEKQGFDPMEHVINDVVDVMERLESTEDFDNDKDTKQVAKGKSNGKSGKKSHNSNGKQKFYCMYHGDNTSHNTENCHKMKQEAKRLKGESNGNQSYGKSKNKTWSRKAEEAKDASKKDLAVFIRKEAKKQVKKDLKTISKKRKSEDSDSDGELHMLDLDLKDFNYDDMENLKINDEDTVTDEIST